MQGQGIYFPRQRDLRRARQHVGLRALGRGARRQHQARVVEEVRAGVRIQRRRGLRHPDEHAGVGGERPRGRLFGPTHGLPRLQVAPQGRHADRELFGKEGVSLDTVNQIRKRCNLK